MSSAHCTQHAAGSPLGVRDVLALFQSPALGNGHGQIHTSGGCTGGGTLDFNADGDLNDQANADFTMISSNDQLNAGFTDGDFFIFDDTNDQPNAGGTQQVLTKSSAGFTEFNADCAQQLQQLR